MWVCSGLQFVRFSVVTAFNFWLPSLLVIVIAVNSIFLHFYFGTVFRVPMEVLGPHIAGTATGFSNLFANIGGLITAYALGAVKDRAGTFTWGFVGLSGVCLAGIALAVILALMRQRALGK
jgi:nitrate/nitrite transporter NarK